MTSLDSFPPELLKKITDQLSYQEHVTLSLTCHRLLEFVPACSIETLKLNLVGKRLKFTAIALEKAVEEREGKTKEPIKNQFRSFDFPPSGRVVLFKKAKIGHLEISKNFPIPFGEDNLTHFSNLLTGCSIDKATLVLDKEMQRNLNKVLEFIVSIHFKKIDFTVFCFFSQTLSEFQRGEFLCGLVAAGIEEVSISAGSNIAGITSPPEGDILKWDDVVGLLLHLFDAGIKCVIVNPDSFLINYINKEDLNALLERLTTLKKSLKLQLNLLNKICVSSHIVPEGPYRRKDDAMVGRRVQIDELKHPRGTGHLVTIEYK